MIPRRDSWNRDEGSRDKLIVCVRVCMYDRMQGRRWSEYLLAVEHPEGFGRHTIDAPVGVPVLVAYRYREPSVIRSDKMDQLSLAALDPQCFPLAGVRGVVPICNRNGRKLLNYRVTEIYIYIKRFNYLRKRSKQLNIPFHFSTVRILLKGTKVVKWIIVRKRYNLKKCSVRRGQEGRETWSFRSLSNVSFSHSKTQRVV